MEIVKVCTSQGSLGKNSGCEEAPEAILSELKKIEVNESGKKIEFKVSSAEINENNLDETNLNIENTKGDVFLGGDHSITYPLFKSFAKEKKNAGLLIFDAHPDCALYVKTASHEDFVRKLVDDGFLKKENLVYAGLRRFSKVENDFLRGIKCFNMKDLFLNTENACDNIMEICRHFDELYLSIDIDVLDPGFAPGTGYLEPGGLSIRELIYFIKRLKFLKNLKRIDLVEVNPKKDINEMTVKLAAKILSELL
ncbi:arginase family protein [Candidatus Woesearchaeota archaeon]|nr:arginase family protein [Candidatus Woesearchaeota archaeon]